MLSHPFFARTDAAGKARLEGVPAGSLRVARHRRGLEHGGGGGGARGRGEAEVRIVVEK